MEGLIPYLLHAIKKQRPHRHSFRCLSDTSNRSYQLLIGADSAEGSSHRRTRSEFQPPALDHFSDQRSSGLDYFPNVRSFGNRAGSVMSPAASKPKGLRTNTESAITSGYQASFSMASTVNHRR